MKTSDCAETLCGHIRQVKKAEVTKFIAEVQADVCREGHPCGKPSLCLECKAVGCISAAGDVVNIEGTQSCIARHMKASGHTLSLYLPTGQISCSVCNVDSFRSMIIGYTGTDNAGLAKLNTFNEYIVKCWNERQASSKQLSKEQQEKLFWLISRTLATSTVCFSAYTPPVWKASIRRCLFKRTARSSTDPSIRISNTSMTRCLRRWGRKNGISYHPPSEASQATPGLFERRKSLTSKSISNFRGLCMRHQNLEEKV